MNITEKLPKRYFTAEMTKDEWYAAENIRHSDHLDEFLDKLAEHGCEEVKWTVFRDGKTILTFECENSRVDEALDAIKRAF